MGMEEAGPPPQGWTLREAAEALFPTEWATANLSPDDPYAALAALHPSLGAGRAPWAVTSGDRLPGAQRTLAQHAAIVAAEAARERLQRLLSDRMQAGDLLAYGTDPAEGLSGAPTAIPPHVWGIITPHFGWDRLERDGGVPHNTKAASPDAADVTGLPGGRSLVAVRIKTAEAPEALPKASTEDLFWFMSGYAVRALETGKPATRQEHIAAAQRENVGTVRQVEAIHAKRLLPKLKGADKSKGANRPK